MTPIAHSAVGLLGWRFSDGEKSLRTLFLFILVSNIPDIDFLFYLFDREGSRIHQLHTHNVFFIGFFTLLMFLFLKTRESRIALTLVAFSHLILDVIIIDPVPPIGFRIFYPVWDRLFNLGFFPNFLRGGIGDIFSGHNLLTVSLEILVVVAPVLFLCRKHSAVRLKKKGYGRENDLD